MPSTFKLTPVDPPQATPDQVAATIKAMADLNNLTVDQVHAMWHGYVTAMHRDTKFAIRKLDVLQLSADCPSNN